MINERQIQTTMFSSISLPDNVAEVWTMDMRVDGVVMIIFADIICVILTGVVVVAKSTTFKFDIPVLLEGSILSC